MMIYLRATSEFLTTCKDNTLKQQLKNQYHTDSRRMSRFTRLALLGSLSLSTLPKNCSVCLTSSFSSPQLTSSLIENCIVTGNPSPFDFIANLNHAGSFHVARYLKLKGNAIFMVSSQEETIWTQAILHAIAYLNQPYNPPHILLGWCHEFKPILVQATTEGSHWLWLSRTRTKDTLATLQVTPTLPKHIINPIQSNQTYDTLNNYYWLKVHQFIQTIHSYQPFYLQTALDQYIIFNPI